MKSRNGFVSNSSSSSYIIYGHRIDENNIERILELLELPLDDKGLTWESPLYNKLEELGIEGICSKSADPESLFLGNYISIDYVDDLTDDLKALSEDKNNILKNIEDKLQFQRENARFWGIRSDD
jgi:hypothetical protein